ncbi:winged helix-turn-helix transcriptional regulator [Streptomyces sp. NPDC056486]|uniref:winged helix-turn-helix transcriptional regulator n=1 Tax=Streptomyces sp. NPDC056486 TaxID=3345835 RepID=UPI00369C29E5
MKITLTALRGRWTTLIVRELLRADAHADGSYADGSYADGSYAYSELASTFPELSDKVLTERLAAHGRLRTHPHGRELGPALQALWDWGARMPAPPTAEEADVT